MRILQIIDSLDIGGAEKMAINYANALSRKVEFSGLVATRKEGNLKNQLSNKVDYLFLNRKKIFDTRAILKMRNYCISNNIDYLQPHSSSFFTALLVKILLPKIKIIWHDHNGLSEFLSSRKTFALKVASFFFEGIIVVNDQLKQWAEKELNCKRVIYLPNFTSLNNEEIAVTKLVGVEGKKILSLANLRFQKDHFLLLKVAEKLMISHPEWTFHLVGKDFEDDYSDQIKKIIVSKKLQNNVIIYGSKNDTTTILNQADIAILTSQSEGLPVAILEYGLVCKPVVTTEVGEIPLIIKNNINGFIVPKYDEEKFYDSLVKIIEDEKLRSQLGKSLNETILKNHSESAIISNYLNWV
jgi:glycosyltransferase involved in cell wall biosynthesis